MQKNYPHKCIKSNTKCEWWAIINIFLFFLCGSFHWDGMVNKQNQEAFAQWQWVRFNCHLFSLNYVEIIEHHVVFAANIRNSFARKLNDLWEKITIINFKIPCFKQSLPLEKTAQFFLTILLQAFQYCMMTYSPIWNKLTLCQLISNTMYVMWLHFVKWWFLIKLKGA